MTEEQLNQLEKFDAVHQYFQWNEPTENVTGMRIVNTGESIAISEIEIFQ